MANEEKDYSTGVTSLRWSNAPGDDQHGKKNTKTDSQGGEYSFTCLCKSITVTLSKSATPALQVICHCHDCRAWNSSTVVPYVLFGFNDIHYKINHQDEKLDAKALEDKYLGQFSISDRVHRYFCKTCHIALFNSVPTMQLRGTYPALFPEFKFKPTCHTFYKERVMSVNDSLPKYEDTLAQFGGSGKCI
eukprot:TRINITY_DN8763_c0_g1_i1.p1 TRINITY_DN8763_c0_g1~~TRINITY_DN8763_c0_g1_i1.p1  ORF type:complete len:190 (-),score=14.94 TRINITY_DN8763_c0_g1_i1:41-610(-)